MNRLKVKLISWYWKYFLKRKYKNILYKHYLNCKELDDEMYNILNQTTKSNEDI